MDDKNPSPWHEPIFRIAIIMMAAIGIGLLVYSWPASAARSAAVDQPPECPGVRASLQSIIDKWDALARTGEYGRVWTRLSTGQDNAAVFYGITERQAVAVGYLFNRGCLVFMSFAGDPDELMMDLTGLSRQEIFNGASP